MKPNFVYPDPQAGTGSSGSAVYLVGSDTGRDGIAGASLRVFLIGCISHRTSKERIEPAQLCFSRRAKVYFHRCPARNRIDARATVDPADIDAAVRAVEQAGGTVLDHGEFCPGEPYVFFRDLDGYEVEIWHEIPTPVDPT